MQLDDWRKKSRSISKHTDSSGFSSSLRQQHTGCHFAIIKISVQNAETSEIMQS